MKKVLKLLSVICIIVLVIQLPGILLRRIMTGEFPFKLVYESDGEICSIEDIIVCEYDGIDYISSAGLNLKWNTYLKNKNETQDEEFAKIVLLDLSDKNIYDDFGNKIIELYFYGGNAEYYLNVYPASKARNAQGFDGIGYRYIRENGTFGHSFIGADEAYEKYKLCLLSFDCAPPVKRKISELLERIWQYL